MKKVFISVYFRYYKLETEVHDSIEQAISSLEYGSDYGELLPVAVIDNSNGEMVWYCEFLGEYESSEIVKYIIGKRTLAAKKTL